MADTQSNIQVNIDTTQALASIKNLQRQISAFHSSMAKGGAAANAVSTQLQQTLINSINATGQFSAGIRTIRTTTESFTNSLEKNKFSLGEYFRYAGGATRTFGRLFKTEHDTINKVARENVKDLQTQYIRLGRDASGAMKSIAVRPLALDMTDLGTRTQIAAQKQAILNQLLKQGSTNLLNFGKNTQWAGRQLMVGFTLPLIAVGSAASKTFMDMEAQAIRFKKVYGDLFTPTGESQQALKDIQELGKEFTKYGIAVSTTVGLAAEAAAAGFKGADLQRQTAAATRLSILGQVESQKALETTIALQNAFSMSSENLAESIDFLNAVENQTVLSLDDIATAIPKAAPVVQQLGGDVKDLAFLMTAMKEGGINASEGANALKSGLASLINPTGKANDMLLSFGINAKKIVLDNKGDLKKTVVEFATALNMLDPLNRAQAIEQMFGKFQFSRLSTLFANVTKEGTQASRVLDLAGASVQELAGLAEKELGMTSESAMNKFKGAVENLKLSLIPLGEQFLKAVTPIAEFLTKVLDKFNGFSDNTKKIIVVLTGIVAGLGPVLLMTVGLVMNGLANMIKLFAFLKSAFNRTGQATAILGTEVQYMTTEQRNAAAVAASLDQVHVKLAQTFTSEASAVNALTRAYQRAIAAQSQFVPVGPPITRGPIPKFADGRPLTVGGTGNKDSELALLMPGETVIPTKMSKKYGPLINAMIAGNIPGYEFGKEDGTPGAFSFGGREFPVKQASIPSVKRFIAQIQQLGGVVSNIDDVIFKVLEDMTSELEKGAKITKSGLEKAMAASNITELAKSTKAAQGSFEGNAGAVMAHGLPKITLTPEQIRAFEGTTVGTRLAVRVPGAPVTGLSNMVFPMPAAFNQDRMTGAEGAQWIGQNRTRFTADFAAQAGLDPNDPDLLRFGTAVGKALKSAAHRGVVVTQEDFERIISQALEKEIFDVGKNTSTAVKTAFADAKKVSTLMFPTVSKSGRTGYSRVPVTEDMRGTTVAGIPLAQGSSYKNRGVTGAQHEAADKFTMKAVRARVRRFFIKMPKEVEQEVKKVLDINSPSRATKKLGNDTATGFVSGVKELNDEARAAGQQVGSSVVSGATQSGRARRVATRPQGPAPIGATPQPGMRILPIVPPNPKGPIPPDPDGPNPTGPATSRARGIGTRINSMGGGMGLLGVNMGLSMLPDFAGKGVIQGSLAGANLGMMFGGYGMAAGAAIGLVTSAVSALIAKYKELDDVTAATFKSSAELATFFGNKVADTTLKVGTFSASITNLKVESDGVQQSFGYTNEELTRFIALIDSLPEDNALREIVDALTKEDNAAKINKLAQEFITTQIALGNIKPDQAQKTLDLMLAASDKVSMVGVSFITFQSQTEAVSATLKNASISAKTLGDTLLQLLGIASNSTSLEEITIILEGIGAASLNTAEALDAMGQALKRNGASSEYLNAFQILSSVPGIDQKQLIKLLTAASKGMDINTTGKTPEQLMKEATKFLDEVDLNKPSNVISNIQTKAYQEIEKQTAASKKQIDILKKKKKIIDDQLKQQEKISSELKRQNDYLDKQADLDKQIVEAKIRGDYIGAANLLQAKTQNTAEFNAETEKSKLQAKSDALQAQIDALQLKNDELVSAINKSATDQVAATNTSAASIVDAIIKFGTITGPADDVANKSTAAGESFGADRKKVEAKTLKEAARIAVTGRQTQQYVPATGGPGFYLFQWEGKTYASDKMTGVIYNFDTEQNKVGTRAKYASGGMIRGAGTGTSDSIPAYLSNGEYVIKAKSVKKYGVGALDALNAGRFATGGQVGRSASSYIPRLDDGGLIPEYRFGGLASRLFGGLSKLASKIIPQGFLNKLSKNGTRTQTNTGSVDLPTPTIIDPVKPITPTIIDPVKPITPTIIDPVKPPATKVAMPTNPDAPFDPIDSYVISNFTEKPLLNADSMAYTLSKATFGKDSGTFYRALSDHDMAALAGYTRVPNPYLRLNPSDRARFAAAMGEQMTDKTVPSNWGELASDWKFGTDKIFKEKGELPPMFGSEASLPFLDLKPGLAVGQWWRPNIVKSITRELDFAKHFAVQGGSSGGMNKAIAKIIVEPDVRGLADFKKVIPTHNAANHPFVPEWTEGAIAPYTKYVLEAINKNAHRYTDEKSGVSHLIDEYVLRAVETAPYRPFLDSIVGGQLLQLRQPGKGTAYRQELPIVKKAQGGMIRGAGTPTSDSIPAYLSNGEYVIKADSVKKYGVGTFDALNSGKFANGGLMQRFKNGIPAFGSGGPAWLKRLRTMKAFGFSGALYQAMEEGEKWLSLKHGANENSSGFHKWSKSIARTLYNVPQGAVAGVPFGLSGLVGGAISGGLEGLEGLRRDGSQYGVKGGSRSTEKGFSANKELKSMTFQSSALNAIKAGGISSILGPLISLLPKGIQKAITTKLGQNLVSSALIGIAPVNPTMGIGLPVRPTTAVTNKYVGSALENKIITGVAAQTNAGSRTFAGSVNSIENQMQSVRNSGDVSAALVGDMFASAMRVAEASGRFAPTFLGRSMTAREGTPQFETYQELDPLLDDITNWQWVSNKPSSSPMVNVPTLIDKLSLKQRRRIAFLAGKKSSLVGVPTVTQKELDSGYNWYYEKYGNNALDWDIFKRQQLDSVGLKSPAHKKLIGYTSDTRAFEQLHENDFLTSPPGQNFKTKKFTVGGQRQSDEFDKIYGPNNMVRYETPLMDDTDFGKALRIKFKKVYDELIRTGYIRKAWYDSKGIRHEQKDTAPLPELPGMGGFGVRGKALTPYEFYKAVAATLPDGTTSSKQASANQKAGSNYLDAPTDFVRRVNEIYAQQQGVAPGEKIRFWKYDLYGSSLKNDKGEPVAAGYYSLDKEMAYAYARGRGNNPSQEELDSGSGSVFMGAGPEMAQSRGAYYVDMYPHEVPQVFGLGGLTDEMAIVIGEKIAREKSIFTGMAKASEYQYEAGVGAIRGLSPWKMYAPGEPWTVESPNAVFGVPQEDSGKMADLLNSGRVSLRLGGKREWTQESVSEVLKAGAPFVTKSGTSRFVAQDAIPKYWGSGAELALENMLKAQEMYNLIRTHIQKLPKVQLLKTLSKEVPKLANGGLIRGPGTGRSDSIRASLGYAGGGSIRVSNGEYVVKASSVRDYGVKTMDAINNGTATVGANSGGTVYNINMPVTSNNANPEIVANEVMRKLKLEISKNNKTNRVGG